MVLRALWFAVIPLLGAVVSFRYLLPSSVGLEPGAFADFSEWMSTRRELGFPLLFLGYSALIRHFRAVLPGAESFAERRASGESRWREGARMIAMVVVAAGAALVWRNSLFQTYRVVSSSMLPNLRPADLLLASRFAYGSVGLGRPGSERMPARGDVVIFHHDFGPEYPDQLVKRVLGLPGDVIRMKGGHPWINGWAVPDCDVGSYAYSAGEGLVEGRLRLEFLGDATYLTLHGPWDHRLQFEYTVGPREVFVLGDNRNNSSDSRAWNEGRGGGLALEDLRGKVERFLFPVLRNGDVDAARLLEPLSSKLFVEGVDVSALRRGITRCSDERPRQTTPPRADDAGQVARGAEPPLELGSTP